MDEKSFLLEEKYAGIATESFLTDSLRLDAGEPLAYVIGWIPFLDCRIYLDSHPLIPRSETEYWTEKAVHEIQKHPEPRVLDLFAGSGAIGVAVLKHVPGARVDFGEIDTAHFPTIQKNISENGISESRVRIEETDVWSNVTGTYDFVLANPPYISKNRADRVQASVLTYEPEKALFADDDGFALIQKLILGAKPHLTPKGILYMEHEPEQNDELQATAKEAGFDAASFSDQFGRLRFSRLRAVA